MDIIPSPKSLRLRTSLNTNSHLIDKRARVCNFLGKEQRLDSREWLSSLRLRIQIAYNRHRNILSKAGIMLSHSGPTIFSSTL